MEKKMYKVLLVTGIVTDEHDPKVNRMLRRMLEATGRFEVKITEEFRGASMEMLDGYDAILLNYDGKMNLEAPYVGLGETTERVICDFVAAGGGIIIYHSSAIMGEPVLEEEFSKMIGGTYRFDNGGRKSPKLAFSVDTVYGDPITEDLPPVWITGQDDLFANMQWRSDCSVKVLATVYDALEDYDINKMQRHLAESYKGTDFSSMENMNSAHPVIWKNIYKKGRVFVPFIGHGPDTLRRPEFVALMCRGAEWVCSGEVTIPVPDLQREKRIRVWPYYEDVTIKRFNQMTEWM